MTTIAEQFGELYSRCSLLDKAAKEAQLEGLLRLAQWTYWFLMLSYGLKGYLTQEEYNQVEQIRQDGQYL